MLSRLIFKAANEFKKKNLSCREIFCALNTDLSRYRVETFSFPLPVCVCLRVTKVPCLSACPSMATCSVSSTVTWLRTCSTPKRGWMSLSTSWTHRNLSLKRPQESLTTGEGDVKAAVPLFVHSRVQVIIIIFYVFFIHLFTE